MMNKDKPLILERTVNAPSDAVWQALTDITLLKKWMPFFNDFKPEVGFVARFMLGRVPGNEYLHICEVTEVIKGEKLTYSWRYDTLPGDSYVTFELTPMHDKTRVTLTHQISQPFPTDNPDFAMNNFVAGWTSIIDTLKISIEERT